MAGEEIKKGLPESQDKPQIIVIQMFENTLMDFGSQKYGSSYQKIFKYTTVKLQETNSYLHTLANLVSFIKEKQEQAR